jgi:hypothetical protein
MNFHRPLSAGIVPSKVKPAARVGWIAIWSAINQPHFARGRVRGYSENNAQVENGRRL